MSHTEIKAECEHLYYQVQKANARLLELRRMCKHEATFVGDYMDRPGSIRQAEICEFCGLPIQIYDHPTT